MTRRSLIPPLVTGAVLGASLYVWRAVLETTGFDPSTRVGLLPPAWELVVLVAVAAVLAVGLAGRGWSTLPLAAAGFLLLPWLPWRVPAAFLAWTGHVASGALVAVLLTALLQAWPRLPSPTWLTRRVVDPRSAPWAAALLAFVFFLGGAWQVRDWRPGGDEPHYLVITQSLLRDGDLRIENNHERRDFEEYWLGDLPPHYLSRGGDGEIYSVHAPGLSVLVAPAFALFGFAGATVWLALLSALATGLAWRLAYALARSPGAAWFAWAAVALSPPYFFHAYTIFPDGPAAAIVLTGALALARTLPAVDLAPLTRPWLVAHGAALAALPWLHTRYSVLAAALGLAIAGRLMHLSWRRSALISFLALPAMSAAAWLSFFFVIYGTPDPSAPYGGFAQSSLAYIANGLPGLLFDQQFGILVYAPVLLFGTMGCLSMLRGRSLPPARRLAIELLLASLPYLLTASAYGMWWGGDSAPARFAVPLLLLPAVPLGLAWAAARTRATRALALAGLAVTLAASWSLAMGGDGRLVYNSRDGSSLWLLWLTPVVDLTGALPSLFRQPRSLAFAQAAVWLAAIVAAWVAIRVVDRRTNRRDVLALATLLSVGMAATMAVEAGWRLAGIAGPSPTRSSLVEHYDPDLHVTGVQPARLRFSEAAALMREMDIPSYRPEARPRQRRDALYYRPSLPAGSYAIHVAGERRGTVSIELGLPPGDEDGPRPLVTLPLAGDAMPPRFDLPLGVGRISVLGDAESAASAGAVTLRLLEMPSRSSRPTADRARLATRYAHAAVFFLDTTAYMERYGFWLSAAENTRIVVSPDRGVEPPELLLRNGPAANSVTVRVGAWREVFDLGPDEERVVEVPLARDAPTLVEIGCTSGFRPNDVDPTNADLRRLGVWGEFRPR